MRILHTGDLNIMKNSRKSAYDKIFRFVSEVKDSNADLLIVAGDIVAGGIEEDYREALDIFSKIAIEKVFIPGNQLPQLGIPTHINS